MVAWEKLQDERVAAFIDVGDSPERGVAFDEVVARIYRYPEVIRADLVSGGSHLRVIVEGEGIRHVAAFVTEKLAPIDDITATDTNFSSRRTRRTDRYWWRMRPTTVHPRTSPSSWIPIESSATGTIATSTGAAPASTTAEMDGRGAPTVPGSTQINSDGTGFGSLVFADSPNASS